MCQISFLPMGKAKPFFCFTTVFAFKQIKEHILIQVQPLKMLNKNKNKDFLLIVGLHAKQQNGTTCQVPNFF